MVKSIMLFTGKTENDAQASVGEKEKGDDLSRNDR